MTYSPDYTKQERYTKGLNYETVLLEQFNRIAYFRSNKDLDNYQYSIDVLIFLLPNDLRSTALNYKKTHNIKHDITTAGLAIWDELLIVVNELLENSNMIFKTRYTKTYE